MSLANELRLEVIVFEYNTYFFNQKFLYYIVNFSKSKFWIMIKFYQDYFSSQKGEFQVSNQKVIEK